MSLLASNTNRFDGFKGLVSLNVSFPCRAGAVADSKNDEEAFSVFEHRFDSRGSSQASACAVGSTKVGCSGLAHDTYVIQHKDTSVGFTEMVLFLLSQVTS